MDLVDVKSKNAGLELDLAAGKFVAVGSLKDDAEVVKGSVVVEVDVVKSLKLLAEKIPGSVDDAVIGVVVAAFEAVSKPPAA